MTQDTARRTSYQPPMALQEGNIERYSGAGNYFEAFALSSTKADTILWGVRGVKGGGGGGGGGRGGGCLLGICMYLLRQVPKLLRLVGN